MVERMCLVGVLAFGPCVTAALAQDDAAEGRSQIDALRKHLEQSVHWYEFVVAGREKPLQPRIVLRWDNQVRGTGSAVGLTVVWTDDTRPQAIAAIYPWYGTLNHECDLLAREANVLAKRDGRIVWEAKETGIEFRDVPDAPPPAKTASRRRLQLKQLAGRFEATMLGWVADNSDRQELRMLPQWLYRYGREGADCMDGAIFAYVMGTDPEAALLLEAYRTDDGDYRWQYAFVRRTSGGLEARLDGEVVWNAEKLPIGTDPSRPHLTFSEPLPPRLVPSAD